MPWSSSHDQLRLLYQMQKSGDLDKEPGKALITERLCDGGAMLGALYAAAWEASAMSDKDIKDFVGYDDVSKATPNPMEARPRRNGGGGNGGDGGATPEPAPAPSPTPEPAKP